MVGLKLHPPLLRYAGIAGLYQAAQRSDMSVSYSPFGWVEDGGTMFIKAPPIAKMKTEEDLAAGTPSQKRIAGGLGRAKGISKAHHEKGVVVVNIAGRAKRMPTKAAEMMKEGPRKELIRGILA